ncbi:uncharacterized protein LOC129606954 [Condylostylus longicornis]|uniref:uncharacterized protein LOC129606954 n=1 Tax=Condylostylus longicornis TaxID=2530218 RepID=UPI00244E5169|nr:uncharacterized protein LOC129606954 [Condylostylus longicornis]
MAKNFDLCFPNSCIEAEQQGVKENSQKVTPFVNDMLKHCINIRAPNQIMLDAIIEKSNAFPIEFPINTCKIKSQPKDRYLGIEFQANSVRPIIHERVLWLYVNFLEHKIAYGDKSEKKIYQNMTICEFVQRLLEKRCVAFLDGIDSYLLLDGTRGSELYKQQPDLNKYLSYEEVKLSALLSVSSHTEFINSGSRNNCGKIPKSNENIEKDGVIIGLIGARFERPNEMEYQDILIEEKQNKKENGYGYYKLDEKFELINTPNIPDDEMIKKKIEYRKLWNNFYNETDFEYNKAVSYFASENNNGRLTICRSRPLELFDTLIMKKRYAISFDTLLLDAESRASVLKKPAFIHVVGIGLGVWKCCKEQENIFLETFKNRIYLLKNQLKHVKCINFARILKDDMNEKLKLGEFFEIKDHPYGGIKFLYSNREPHLKLEKEFSDCLLVASYAWDGNALPGNEFWMGFLAASGDPAAACSTLITELHNTHINNQTCNGNNLHIATFESGVIHIADYAKKVLNTN